jgi:enoyl-CoA hydratase/carnithine racemase
MDFEIMSRFDAYRHTFPNAGLTRSKGGVLEVALHTAGDTLAFNGYTHEQFVDLFHAIASDADNRVVILTGSGSAFMESIRPEGFDFFTPQGRARQAAAAHHEIHPHRAHPETAAHHRRGRRLRPGIGGYQRSRRSAAEMSKMPKPVFGDAASAG